MHETSADPVNDEQATLVAPTNNNSKIEQSWLFIKACGFKVQSILVRIVRRSKFSYFLNSLVSLLIKIKQ